MQATCTLCNLKLPKTPLKEENNLFCCAGCVTVFNIIGAQENYQTHSLFQEALKSGVIANPEIVHKEEEKKQSTEELKFHLHIEGMWCPSCADAIQWILLKQKGVLTCIVDYATDLAILMINPCALSKSHVMHLIEKIGYRANELLSAEKKGMTRSLWLRFSIAAFCAMNLMMFSYPLYAAHFGQAIEGYGATLGWFSLVLALPVVSYCAWPIWRRLGVSFKSRIFGMETLVLMGVGTGFVLSTGNLLRDSAEIYFDSLSMVITFVLLGKICETKAKFSAKETLFKLSYVLPKKAYKQVGEGTFSYVPLKEVAHGDILFVRSGEKIIFDSKVIKGEALVDESVVNGEVLPQHKITGDPLIGGSLLRQGSLTLQVEKIGDESLLGKILSLIEKDLMQKNHMHRLVDKITRVFVPSVLALALIALCVFGFTRSLSLLLIACPCALGIAAPIAHSRLYYRFAEKGAFVRARNQIHLLAENPFFVFDKTGTLTEGKFQVLKGLEVLDSFHASVLKALCSISKHPLSTAISNALPGSSVSVEKVEEVIGRGIKGECQGKSYLVGSDRFFGEYGINVPAAAGTVVYFAEEGCVLTEIHLQDRLRSHLPQVEGGILSGDSSQLVSALAEQCGLQWGKGGMDPLQKREEILKLKSLGRPVVMVGDGINDAPAMTAADLGISVVSATDLAVEVSDILLTTEHLDALPTLCKFAKKCRNIVYQNLFWAFFYNIIGIFLALSGIMNPFLAALAMVLSSFCVLLNTLRL